MDVLAPLARALNDAGVRYVVVGVWGANYWARSAAQLFTTLDQDLFLPLEPDNLLWCWSVCEAAGLDLVAGVETLDRPRDRQLAERVVERRALTRALGRGLQIDLTLVMGRHDFDAVWAARREFYVDGVAIPVARLLDIVTAKEAAGRDKDRLFLATHKEALEQLLKREDEERGD